ncbi:MAG: metallophosphoesterase [Tepidisphaeraceae bacterium]
MNYSADQVIETFEVAKEENALDRYRQGQVVVLPADHEVWMTGDIHDHRTNFKKLLAAARLPENPNRHLVLHELIHGDHFDANGCEDSWRMLYQAAELKLDFPDQVHFLFANHDLAQIHGEGIMKAGLSVCEAFNKGVKRDFPNHDLTVQMAITEFLLSLPLAIRCPNGLWFSHSIPTDEQVEAFDYSVFERSPLTSADYKKKVSPVYQLIWGRKYSEAGVKAFAEKVGAKLLITGHQPQEMGATTVGDQMLIIDSSHNQGVFLPLSTSEEYDIAALRERLRKFVAVELEPQD